MLMGLRPPYRWIGGKRKLARHIWDTIWGYGGRKPLTTYVEPFIGGGAMLVHGLPHIGFDCDVVIAEYDPDVRSFWEALGDGRGRDLDHQFRAYRDRITTRAAFQEVQDEAAAALREGRAEAPWKRGGRFASLLDTAFNNKWVRSKDGSPFLHWHQNRNSSFWDASNIMGLSMAMERLKSFSVFPDFREVPSIEDAVYYCDPPYDEGSKVYSERWDLSMQSELKFAANLWVANGARLVVVSNSDNENIRELWDGWHIFRIRAARQITGAKYVSELLMIGGRDVCSDGVGFRPKSADPRIESWDDFIRAIGELVR